MFRPGRRFGAHAVSMNHEPAMEPKPGKKLHNR